MASKPSAIVEEARERFKIASEAEATQRDAMMLAKKFRAGDQWPDEIKMQRQGGGAIQGQAAQPPRPCLTIDRLSQPVRQVSNSVRQANFGINVLPNGHGADDDTADIFKGIIRRIQNQARGEAPIDWAADGAAECGIGWFRLRTDYIPLPAGYVGPEVKDQDIHLERITNNLTVYCDPSAQKPTRSDARWMIVTEELPKSEGKRKYGLKDEDMDSLDDFMATGDQTTNGWVTETTFRVAEYWRIVDEPITVVQLASTQEFIEKTDDLPKDDILFERVVNRPTVRMSLINAVKELQKTEWVGSKIPLIPVLGEELNVDGKIILRGIIQEAMDPQRMINYMYSAAIETVALAPKAPFIVAEGQLESYETQWQNANRFNYSYLSYRPTTLAGSPVPPPQRENTEPAIQAMVLMLAKSEEAVKATTGIFDPSLGNTNPREKSGRAIMALQKQSEQGNSNYMDNVQRALVYAGEQLVEIIPKIYDRPGRVLQILRIDDQPQQVMVGQAFQPGPGGAPQAQPGLTKDQVKDPQFDTGLAKFYDLTDGQYAVSVAVSKSHTTKREEGAEMLGEILTAQPEMLQIIGDLWARDLDIPGAQEMAERLKKMLPPQLQSQEGQPQIPPQVQAQMAKAQEMIQMLSQELQAKTEIINTDQIKTQGQLQIASIKEQAETQRTMAEIGKSERLEMAKLQIELRKLEVQAEIEGAKLGSAESMKRLEIETELLHQHTEQQMREQELGADQAQQNMDRMSGAQDAERDRQHESTQNDSDRRLQQSEGEKSRAFESEQADRQRLTDVAMAEKKAQQTKTNGSGT